MTFKTFTKHNKNNATKNKKHKLNQNIASSILLPVLMTLATVTYAQRKNTLTIGAGYLTTSSNAFSNTPEFSYSITPSIGFFPIDNFAFGMRMENGIRKNTEVPFTLNGFGRLYFGKAATYKRVKFYVEAGGGAAHNKTAELKYKEEYPYSFQQVAPTFKGTAYISPGVNIYLGNIFAIELAPEYRYVAGSTHLNRLGVNAGLRLFISKKQFTTAFPHEFNKTY